MYVILVSCRNTFKNHCSCNVYISLHHHNSLNVRSGLNIPVTSTSSQVDTDNIGSALVIEVRYSAMFSVLRYLCHIQACDAVATFPFILRTF